MADDWMSIWDKKGLLMTNDLKTLDGYEDTDIDLQQVAENIIDTLQITHEETILEVGCGAGGLAQYFRDYNYFGIDRSRYMIKKFEELIGNNCLLCSADDIPFFDKKVDHVIMYSVAQYFPDYPYFKKVLAEIERVARISVFIGDLPEYSHRDSHQLYSRQWFDGWQVSDGYYCKGRFNVYKRLI